MNQILDKVTNYVNIKYPILIGFLTSVWGVISYYIENYVWAEPSQYAFLVLLIFVNFLLGIKKAHKYKILIPKKIPNFLNKIMVYTLLLLLAFNGAKLFSYLFFLPPLLFVTFNLTTFLSIIKNLGIIGWLPKPLAVFFEQKIGMKIDELLKLDVNDLKTEYVKKVNGILTDMYNYSGAKSVTYLSFETHDFKFQQVQTIARVKHVIGESPFNFNEVLKINQLHEIFECLGIENECKKSWELGNQYTFTNTYIFKLSDVESQILPPMVILDMVKPFPNDITDKLIDKLRKSCSKIAGTVEKIKQVDEKVETDNKIGEIPIQNVANNLEIIEEEHESELDQIGKLF
jgi:hypothetical protein